MGATENIDRLAHNDVHLPDHYDTDHVPTDVPLHHRSIGSLVHHGTSLFIECQR